MFPPSPFHLTLTLRIKTLPVLLPLLILTTTLASPTTPTPQTNTTLLTFDTLSTPQGLAPLPSPYSHLTFSSRFSVFNPHSPALAHLITPQDLNCAVSSPNALLGSRSSSSSLPASFAINATSASEGGFEPWFALDRFFVKPLQAPEPGTKVLVRGYQVNSTKSAQRITTSHKHVAQQQVFSGSNEHEENSDKNKNVLDWHVSFPAGYHLPLEVRIKEFSGESWERLERVEIWAEFGYVALDWEFCVDDLVVGFTSVGEE